MESTAARPTVAYLPEKGWFWYIPLADDIVSVGIVAEKDYLYKDSKDLETIYQSQIKKNLWIEQHVSVGQQTGPYRVTGEYSYRSRHCASDGLLLVGDAFAFLDPVFSSGVFIALRSGELGADAVDAALTAATSRPLVSKLTAKRCVRASRQCVNSCTRFTTMNSASVNLWPSSRN
jgi:flavin-dependent dehydrogenase